jgi:hypothetical protein
MFSKVLGVKTKSFKKASSQVRQYFWLYLTFHLSLFRPFNCKNLVLQNGNSTQQNGNSMLSRRLRMT